MKHVKYKSWKTIEMIDGDEPGTKKVKPGTNCQEERDGIFEGWGLDIHETQENVASFTAGIIIDVITKQAHLIHPSNITFI